VAEKRSSGRLGRGLSSLLGDAPVAAAPGAGAAPAATSSGESLRVLGVTDIRPNPSQPRRRIDPDALTALADSIAATGLLQPVVVRPVGDGAYELIAGERRWRAAQQAGLDTLPAVVRDADERERLEAGLVENLVRQDLDPIDTAQALAALVEDFGQTQADVARSVGRSRPAVANLIRLLELPDDVQEMLADGRLSEGHGRAVLMADGARRRREVARAAVEQGLSVRATEALARAASDGPSAGGRAGRSAPGVADEAMDAFAGAFEAPVRVRAGARGAVVVEIIFDDEAAVVRALDRLDAPGGPGGT
jgi:ParB family chromosome partitioning protein